MDRLSDVLFVLLGWLLGTLTPGIADAIRRPKRRQELFRALRTELSELRYKLALVAHQMRGRSGTMDPTSLDLVRRTLLHFKGTPEDAQLQAGLSTLLTIGDAAYIAAQNARKGKGSPYPVKYELPFLEAHLQDIGLFGAQTQERILRVRAEFHLFNEHVAQVQSFHDRSFTLTGANHQANAGNYEAGIEKLAYRAEAVIRAINQVIDGASSY